MIKIILAEDHVIVRNGIKLLLESQASVEVIGETGNGQGVLDLIEAGLEPDIVLTDINMPVMDGLSLIKSLRNSRPEVKVIMLTMIDSEKYVVQAFLEGSLGYLLKNVTAEELIFAIRTVSNNTKYLCAELAQKLLEKLIGGSTIQTERVKEYMDFTMRELEVLHLIAEGYTNMEMAEKLFLSKRTIEGHRQMLIDKTGSKNTATLIRFAVSNGYLS